MPPPKTLLLYNEPTLPEGHPDAASEHEIVDTVAEVASALVPAGFRVGRLAASHDPDALVAGLRRHRPDVVFNLFEGTHQRGETEAYAAGVLQWAGVPFTGSPSEALAVARSKHLTKQLLRGAGLPTPDFFVVDALPVPLCSLD